jgi:FlaA1/EpsC-like NDP-sugar epimerase
MTSSSYLSKPNTDPAQNWRTAIVGLLYTGVIATGFYLAYEIRFDFLVPPEFQASRLYMTGLVVGLKLIALIGARQLGSLMTYFSIPDFARLVWAMVATSLLLFVMRLVGGQELGAPRGVLLIDFMLCTGGLCAVRLAARILRERISGNRHNNGSVIQQQRIGIIGAGDAGASLAKEFLTNPSRGFKPVVFFDDDTKKHGKLVHGVLVVGKPEEIATAKGMNTLAKIVIAMPTAPAKRVRQIVQLMTEHGLKVETLPSMADLAAGRVKASRIRPVEVQDLLGRETVDLDSEGIRKSITGHVVLVTGAGGSIGSELCRQIAAQAPKQLLLVEQAEGALFLIEQELNELGLGSLAVPLVGDVLDEERMRYIFSHYHPEVVFHAAAHKHVYLMERQPAEAIRNNVLGTRQLAEIAVDTGVDRFVMISTDKAINPTNVMGATKRLAEIQLMAIAAAQEEGRKSGRPESRTETKVDTRAAAEEILRAMTPTVATAARLPEARMAGSPGAGMQAVQNPEARTIGFGVADAVVSRAPSRPGIMESGKSIKIFVQSGLQKETETTKDQSLLSPVREQDSDLPANRTSGLPRTSSRGCATKFMAVRFGNVLGSSGSVIPIFKRQIANGGPVTVTHPAVTRFFMTIPEAVGLVMQASILGQGGEIFVLDMGPPVKIVDLAKQMIELSGFKVGDDIEIKFTGLKPGEKLFEELQHKTEQYTPTAHPWIMRFTTNAMFSESGVQELKQRLYELDSNQLKQLLKQLVPEYTPFLD